MKDMNPVEILERALLEWKRGATSEACLVEGIEQALDALRGPEPDWSEAPIDAVAHAIDSDGTGRWWQVEPEPNGYTWGAGGFNKWSPSGHFGLPLGTDWRLTLRKRPEGQ